MKRILICVLFVMFIFGFASAQEMTTAQAKVAREKFVAEIKSHVGAPYSLGAVGPTEFDCSGLIYFSASESIQVQLPRTAKAIYSYCKRVPDKDREVGDLLFFKTNSSGNISHVGVYIGNNQFISAISDGPNTGVIISSLNQDYWKDKYISAGQFLISGEEKKLEPEFEEEVVTLDEEKTTAKKTAKKTTHSGSSSFAKALVFDAATYVDWSLISPNQFMFKFRGIDVMLNARYSDVFLEPGIGFIFRFNTSLDVFQLPILFTGTVNDFIRFYAGPVISFGEATLIGTDKTIVPSVFPGIIGASFTTPSIDIGKAKLQIVQDISYTVFNNEDNSALSFLETISAGFVMYTGVKVTLPMAMFW